MTSPLGNHPRDLALIRGLALLLSRPGVMRNLP